MKTRTAITMIIAFVIGGIGCTNAPKSDEAVTTEAKNVNTSKTGESWKVNTTESKVEWVATKVTGYHTGVVPVKSGEIMVNNGEVTGGKFILDLANLTVTGPKNVDSANSNKLQKHLRSADFFDVGKNPEGMFELISVKSYTGAAVKDSADSRQEAINK